MTRTMTFILVTCGLLIISLYVLIISLLDQQTVQQQIQQSLHNQFDPQGDEDVFQKIKVFNNKCVTMKFKEFSTNHKFLTKNYAEKSTLKFHGSSLVIRQVKAF